MKYDFVVIGGGIAGASIARYLSEHSKVILLEREEFPAHHTTGRSAAAFGFSYGNELIQELGRQSFDFLDRGENNNESFLCKRGMLLASFADDEEESELLGEIEVNNSKIVKGRKENAVDQLAPVSAEEARELFPAINLSRLEKAHYNEHMWDIDVHGLMQSFLTTLKKNGGGVRTKCNVVRLERDASGWSAKTNDETFSAGAVVNASGCWANEVAAQAGVAPFELVFTSRTVVQLEVDIDLPHESPLLMDANEAFYIKPDTNGILVSPMDDIPVKPSDVQADELQVALAIHRMEFSTSLKPRKVISKWAGIRSFANDKTPVVGPSPNDSTFIWHAGLGAYGIMTSPALGRIAADLTLGNAISASDKALLEAMSPHRST